MRKLIQLVSTHHSCTKRRWSKMLSDWLPCTLNKVTRKFIWPMPKVEDIFSQLNGVKYFSTLDLWAGYCHIALDEASIPKTAFTSPFGKYEIYQGTFWTPTNTSILPRTDDRNMEGFQLCHYLFGWHHHPQLNSRRTPRPHKTSLWEVKKHITCQQN